MMRCAKLHVKCYKQPESYISSIPSLELVSSYSDSDSSIFAILVNDLSRDKNPRKEYDVYIPERHAIFNIAMISITMSLTLSERNYSAKTGSIGRQTACILQNELHKLGIIEPSTVPAGNNLSF